MPTAKADNGTMQMPEVIPITMGNLEKGELQRNQCQGGSSADNNPPPLEDTPTRADTTWSRAGSVSENVFESREDWPILPHTYIYPYNKS